MLRWIRQIRIYFKILLNETENPLSDLRIQIRIALKERSLNIHVSHYYCMNISSQINILYILRMREMVCHIGPI
jgi:hypothetical protein